MLFAIAKGCKNNLLRFFIYNYLALKSVSFLLTGVKMFLPVIAILYSFFLSDFFLGRYKGPLSHLSE
jgi:hypothetical protein